MGILKRTLYSIEQNALSITFDLLSHPGRLKIILLLIVNDSMSLGQLKNEIGLSQSATSDQVKLLSSCGLIRGVEVGTSIRYSLNREMWELITQLNVLFWNQM